MDPVTLALIGGAALLFVAAKPRAAANASGTIDDSGTLHQGGAGRVVDVSVTPSDASSPLGEPPPRAPAGLFLSPALFGSSPTDDRSTALTSAEAKKRAKRVRRALAAVRRWILKQRAKTPGRRWRKEVRREITGRQQGDLEPIMAAGGVPTDFQIEAVVRAAMAKAPQPWGAEHVPEALDTLWARFGKGL